MDPLSHFEVCMQSVSNPMPKFFAAVLFASVLSACGDSSGANTASGSAAVKDTAKEAAGEVKAAVEEAAPAAATPAEVAVADGPTGEETYNKLCLSCHAAGLSGAPKLGDAEDWGPREAKGLDALVASTISGVPPAMPARGLCFDCTDEQLRDTVAWMMEQQ